MATINEKVAIAAWDGGWLFKKLDSVDKSVLHQQVVTMNAICRAVLEHPLSLDELSIKTGLHKNTCCLYARWMHEQGILLKKVEGQGAKAYYAPVHTLAAILPGFSSPNPFA